MIHDLLSMKCINTINPFELRPLIPLIIIIKSNIHFLIALPSQIIDFLLIVRNIWIINVRLSHIDIRSNESLQTKGILICKLLDYVYGLYIAWIVHSKKLFQWNWKLAKLCFSLNHIKYFSYMRSLNSTFI